MLPERTGLGDGELGIADFPRLLGARLGEPAGPGSGAGEPAALLAGSTRAGPGGAGRIAASTSTSQPRPGKSARGFCVAVRVPGEVHLVVDPAAAGGPEALLHEAGHAQHRAHTDPELDVGARRLGDNGVTESWAFLLEGLPAGSQRDDGVAPRVAPAGCCSSAATARG